MFSLNFCVEGLRKLFLMDNLVNLRMWFQMFLRAVFLAPYFLLYTLVTCGVVLKTILWLMLVMPP